ncbi:MAG: hypothetical protein Q8L14_12020 [Myxococcales bacterium]|nr:hypothetical protein [Myxococcales bacterium]
MHDVVRSELRPTDTSATQMFRFEPSERVEAFGADGGDFLVHFTRAGRNRVPAADANDSGVPDFVEGVSDVYERVGATYLSWGFRRPPLDSSVSSNGGDGRFDVYLLDFAGSADGAFRQDGCTEERCSGFMVQENDFAGYGYPSLLEATRILGSHEFFHAVQAGYDAAQDVVVSEGTAVWATEQEDPTSADFENFIGASLAVPGRSIDSAPAGPVPASAYGSALFFRFLSERFEPALVRALWEHLENGKGFDSEPENRTNPTWVVQLDALLRADYQSSFARAFEEYATWNLFLADAADASRSYRNGNQYPAPAVSLVAAPYRAVPLRVFYASTQYLRMPVGGRATMTAALFDDPGSDGDETEGLVLVVASRRQGRNLEVTRLAGSIDTSAADELIVAVINTARAGVGMVLSKRPGLCIGTADEVAGCQTVDARRDAGVDSTADAGMALREGQLEGPAAGAGCGCTASDSSAVLLLLVAGALTRRRRAKGYGGSLRNR